MNKKEKTRFLTKIIWLCIINIMAYGWAIYMAGCFGVNAGALGSLVNAFAIVSGALGVELIAGAFIRLFGEKAENDKTKKENPKATAENGNGDWG